MPRNVLFETDRLQVRWLEQGDLGAMVTIFNDPEVAHWIGDGQPLGRGDCLDWIAPDNDGSIRILEGAGMVYLHTGPDQDALPTATYRLCRSTGESIKA